ncbi:MAG: hypothetical protein U0T83_02835 [Bacteriovoracaceae bacterium]
MSISVIFVTVASATPSFKTGYKSQSLPFEIPVESSSEESDCNDNCELEFETQYLLSERYISLTAPYKITKTIFFIPHQTFENNFIDIQKPPLV